MILRALWAVVRALSVLGHCGWSLGFCVFLGVVVGF